MEDLDCEFGYVEEIYWDSWEPTRKGRISCGTGSVTPKLGSSGQ